MLSRDHAVFLYLLRRQPQALSTATGPPCSTVPAITATALPFLAHSSRNGQAVTDTRSTAWDTYSQSKPQRRKTNANGEFNWTQ
ncbi:hypothetical protein GCM10010387_03490 [Streptomyces inusitatus]|uniref:Uncharacterized protein n=1 Tax=Streptomyces inusitatus TaxID=68221 RepID=A0A918PM96_9ACTN|nr:hypothetical protein GCM10010387_03490 [Streptomyces inusitatus]